MKSDRLWRPTGAEPDQIVPPDAELCIVDERGRIVVLVVADSEPRCPRCGILLALHDPDLIEGDD